MDWIKKQFKKILIGGTAAEVNELNATFYWLALRDTPEAEAVPGRSQVIIVE